MKNALKDSGTKPHAPETNHAEEVLDVVLPVDGSDAKRKVVLLANACGSGAKDDRPASASGGHRDAARSTRCHSAQPSLDPDHTLGLY